MSWLQAPATDILNQLKTKENLFCNAQISVYKRIPAERIFYSGKLNTSEVAVQNYSEAAFHDVLQKTYQENIQCAVLVLINLQVSCLEELFYTYISPPREFCSKFSERFQNLLILFFYQGFLSQALTFHRQRWKGGNHLYSSLPLPPTH